jgi:hypothetical protein
MIENKEGEGQRYWKDVLAVLLGTCRSDELDVDSGQLALTD